MISAFLNLLDVYNKKTLDDKYLYVGIQLYSKVNNHCISLVARDITWNIREKDNFYEFFFETKLIDGNESNQLILIDLSDMFFYSIVLTRLNYGSNLSIPKQKL